MVTRWIETMSAALVCNIKIPFPMKNKILLSLSKKYAASNLSDSKIKSALQEWQYLF